MAAMNKARQALVDMMLKDLDKGILPWSSGIIYDQPFNAATNRTYKGINLLNLYFAAIVKNSSDPRWMTFNQAKDKGYKIKAKAKGVPIELFKNIDKRTNKEVDVNAVRKETEHMSVRERQEFLDKTIYPLAATYYVFNGQDIDGIAPYKPRVTSEESFAARNERIEKIIETSQAKVFYDGNGKNYYNRNSDEIHLTQRAAFDSAERFYSTALHEMGHSTGHESRLNRKFGLFGTPTYAKEELIAELCSVMSACELGLNPSDRELDNNKAYIQSWAQIIRNDPQELITAAYQASKATDFLCFPEKRKQAATADEKDNNSSSAIPTATSIPATMLEQPHWCAYKAMPTANGKYKKEIFDCNKSYPPSRPTQYFKWAKSNDPNTWTDYASALAFAQKYHLDGVTFALEGSGMTCIDLDHHIDTNGVVSDFAKSVLTAAGDTYAEKSVSGRGIHVFYSGKKPEDYNNRNDKVGLEVYDSARFICVTGNLLPHATSAVKPAAPLLISTLKSHLTKMSNAYVPQQLSTDSDVELIERIRKSKRGVEFEKLYAGEDIMGDHSRSDFALCNSLAFFSKGNAEQVERIFRTSGLYRESKGDAYVKRTAEKACATLTKVYDSQYNAPSKRGNQCK